MSKGNPRRSNGSRRDSTVRWLRSQGRPCWICGTPIDYSLGPGLQESFECDELAPVSRGGSPYDRSNVDASHRCCNNWRKAKSVQTVKGVRAAVLAALGPWSSPEEFVAKAKALPRGARAREIASMPRPKTTTVW